MVLDDSHKNHLFQLGLVAHSYNLIYFEAEAGGPSKV
jgi:hypothetical protein